MVSKTTNKEQQAARRHQGFEWLKQERLSQPEIAQRWGVSEAAVSQWQKVLREQGMKGVKAKQSSGRPNKLSSDEQARLLTLLCQGAKEARFFSER